MATNTTPSFFQLAPRHHGSQTFPVTLCTHGLNMLLLQLNQVHKTIWHRTQTFFYFPLFGFQGIELLVNLVLESFTDGVFLFAPTTPQASRRRSGKRLGLTIVVKWSRGSVVTLSRTRRSIPIPPSHGKRTISNNKL